MSRGCGSGLKGLVGDRRYMVVRPDGSFITANPLTAAAGASAVAGGRGFVCVHPGLADLGLLSAQFDQDFGCHRRLERLFFCSCNPDGGGRWFSQLLGNQPSTLAG